MSYGIWPDWMIYVPPSSADLGATSGRGNVIRDCAREILSAIAGLTLLGPPDGVVWRGHADSLWRLESKMGRLGLTADEMTRQERQMLHEAREIGADNAQHLGDWEILARLRHHGAATRLIDFTTDPLVALWFLCNDQTDVDAGESLSSAKQRPGVLLALQRAELGAVPSPYLRNYGETLKKSAGNLLYRIPPIDPRIAAQRGVFAFGTKPLTAAECAQSELGLPLPGPTWRKDPVERLSRVCDTEKWANRRGQPIKLFPMILGIAIPALVKQKLLDVLETSHGFTWSSMFPDFAGMGQAYAGRTPA